MPHPPVQIHTFHRSAAIWFYWLYTIIKKSTLIEWIHTIYWSAVSFTSDLSLILDSTLLFLEIPHPPVKINTFHRSAAIWFYWLYNIISKNLPLLSESIQYINQLFHLHHTCPWYQIYTTIFENAPSHCANPYIPLISCNMIILIIHYHKKNLPLLSDSILLINKLFHLHLICTFLSINYYYRV